MVFLDNTSKITLKEVIDGLNSFYSEYPKNVNVPEKYIHDCIFGTIHFKKEEMSILDLPCVQRMRNVSQTGLAKYLYPSATHSRFEHSLGVTNILKKMIHSLNKKPEAKEILTDYNKDELYIAGILHDVGHPAFSHNNEDFLKNIDIINEIVSTKSKDPLKTKKPHEIMGCLLVKEKNFMIYDQLKMLGLNPNAVANNIVGQSENNNYKFMAELLSGVIDADRIDYLLRDAHFTGLPYGTIDVDRLINTLDIHNYEKDKTIESIFERNGKKRQTIGLVVQEKGYHAAQALLQAKSLLYPAFYHHPVVRITEILFKRIIKRALEYEYISIIDLLTLGDLELLYKIEVETKKSRTSVAKKLRKDLINVRCRQLFKPVVHIRHFHFHNTSEIFSKLLGMQEDDVENQGYEELVLRKAKNMEKQLCEYLDDKISPEDIAVDILKFNAFVELKIDLKCKYVSEPISITQYLNTSRSIQKSSNFSWRISIYISPEKRGLLNAKKIKDFMAEKYDIKIF